MFGLTTLGIFHTVISLIAVVCGVWALVRYYQITTQSLLGRIYLAATLLTALTGLGIFQHGGFGPPHVLSILTLVALAVGYAATFSKVLGQRSRYLQALCFSATVLFHMIPGFTETLTRLPATQPFFPNADAPALRPIFAVLLLIFLVGVVLQLRWLRNQVNKPQA